MTVCMFVCNGTPVPEDLQMTGPGLFTKWITVWFTKEESKLNDQCLVMRMLEKINDPKHKDILIGTTNLHPTHMWCISIPVVVRAPAKDCIVLFQGDGIASELLKRVVKGELAINRPLFNSGLQVI